MEHALIVARTTNSISEANVQTTYLSSLIWNDKPDRVIETLKKMPKEEQVACCHKLVIFIEGNLNDYVSRYIDSTFLNVNVINFIHFILQAQISLK